MNRRILKPKRRQNRNHHSKSYDDDDDDYDTSTPSGSGVKRKCEDWEETPIKRSRYDDDSCSHRTLKYSANDRLNRYRKILDQKKHQLVKVHKALQEIDVKRPVRTPTSRDVAVTTSGSLSKSLPEGVSNTLIESCSNTYNKSDFYSDSQSMITQCALDEDDMDWSPINEEELAADIRKLRRTIKPQPNPLFMNIPPNPDFNKPLAADDPLYVIVDTNIFMSHLSLIKEISKLHRKLQVKPIIYIPWMVLQELDFFKDGRAGSSNMQGAAKRAVSFINDMLTKKDKALKGQTVHEALSHDFSNSNADDNILFCCLRLQQKNNAKIILLSNDQNLRSKVMVHSIEACSTKSIMNVLNGADQSTSFPRINVSNNQDTSSNTDPSEINSTKPIQSKNLLQTPREKVAEIFTGACTEIIKSELEKAYGDTVYKMITKPPWNLEACLSHLKRFWVPVFSLIITQKQCLKTVDDLLGLLQLCKDPTQESEQDTEEFVKLALSICVYFKNCLSSYEPLMKTCISKIQKSLE